MIFGSLASQYKELKKIVKSEEVVKV